MKNFRTVGLAATLAALTAATALLPAVAANADDWGGRGDRHDAPRYTQGRDRDGYAERQRVVTTERVERDGYRENDNRRERDNFRGRDGYIERAPVVVVRDRYVAPPVVVRERCDYPAPVVVRDRYVEPAPYYEPAPVVVVGGYHHEGPQEAKNNARNVATVGLAAAAVGVLTHNTTLTAVGAIGAIAGGATYENDRRVQSQRRNDPRLSRLVDCA